MDEPRLTREDHEAWALWRKTAAVHARTQAFSRRVDEARRVVGQAIERAPAAVMWSGGKDSTVMTHLVCVDMGAQVDVGSEKDDLDFPGERAYVERLGAAWGLSLHVLEPPESPEAWLRAHASQIDSSQDVHSRAAGLSKACFYDVVERFGAAYETILLGLRKHESQGRRMNRATRGLLYEKSHPIRGAQWVATPIGDWTGLDVLAYAESRGVELLPVYQCIGSTPEHRREPWRVRKSWWVPGSATRFGQTMWLRRYYPSLFGKLCGMLPDARFNA